MRLAMAYALVAALCSATPAAVKPQPSDAPAGAPAGASRDLPPSLTVENFDEFTSQHLTFVEFFSPYCSHCNELAPKWKEAFFQSEADQKKLNIHMRQVNCVENGDLCQREDITFFPNLRLYAPGKDGDKKSRFVDSYPASLSRTPKNLHRYLINSVAEFDVNAANIPSSSQQLDIDLGMQVVSGEISEPYFVALFSSSNEHYDSDRFPSSCLHCTEHKSRWDRLSNQVLSVSKTAHLNCHSHPILCEKLGFSELTSTSMSLAPKYIMFVPKEAGLIRFDYNDELILPKMKLFVNKLAQNYKYEEVTLRELEDQGIIKTILPKEPEDLYFPLTNKMALVFAYDEKNIAPEDRAILPYILEMVTELPFDVSLFVSKSKKFDALLEYQSKGATDFLNSDETFEGVPFNRHAHLVTSLTSRPTLYLFKENSLIPAVFQNFALEDMRMPKKIKEFITKNAHPLYGELNTEIFKSYFSTKKSKTNDKVVITFLRSNNAKEIKETLFNISMVAHQYHSIKREYYFKDLMNKREEKQQRVAKLKEKNVETGVIIEELRAEVPHLFAHDDMLFTYVDLETNPKFADNFGFNINGESVQPGDTVVVTKNGDRYWDQNLQHEKLTTHREGLRDTLKYLLDPALVAPNAKLSSKLVGSPFGRALRKVDFVHQFGFKGYIALIGMVFIVYIAFKKIVERKPGSANIRRGVLPMAKSD